MSSWINGNLQGTLSIGQGERGKSIEYEWRGTELGIRREDEEEYQFVDLAGSGAGSGREIELQIGSGYIQWRYKGEEEWNNLISIDSLKGEKGDIGETGLQGEQGLPGRDGKSLEFNWNGTELGVKQEGQPSYSYVNLKGQDGRDGVDGNDGTNGKDGVTPNLQVGTVTTLEAGQQATVIKRGTTENPIFDFGIPRGQKGENGASGSGSSIGSLLTRVVYNQNKVVQPTSFEQSTGTFTCINHGLSVGDTVIAVPNKFKSFRTVHSELYPSNNKPLKVYNITNDTFILKLDGENSPIVYSSNANVSDYHFEKANPIKFAINDITKNDLRIVIQGVCGVGDMYFSLTKDRVIPESEIIGLSNYKGSVPLSTNATHAPFRPFCVNINIKKTILGFGFMFENRQYSISGINITDRSIPLKYGIIQYPFESFNGILLGSNGHYWTLVNGTTIDIYDEGVE